MRIIYILNKIWRYLLNKRKTNTKNDLDARYWVQDILLKNYLKSIK